MNCKQCQKLMVRWTAGELSASQGTAVELHLTECSECASAYRFHQRVADGLSGSAMLDATVRYKLETELEAVPVRFSSVEKLAAFGANLMKKTVWPATAALVAVGTYTVMFPQGALAEAWGNRLTEAREGAIDGMKDPTREAVFMITSDTAVAVPTVTETEEPQVIISGEGAANIVIATGSPLLKEEEQAFMKAFRVTHQATSPGEGAVKFDWSIDYDKSKFREVRGDKPGETLIVPRDRDDLRLRVVSDPETNALSRLVYERKTDGKWETFGTSLQRGFLMREGVALPMEIDGKARIEIERALSEIKKIDLDELRKQVENEMTFVLREGRPLSEEDKKKLEEAMSRVRLELGQLQHIEHGQLLERVKFQHLDGLKFSDPQMLEGVLLRSLEGLDGKGFTFSLGEKDFAGLRGKFESPLVFRSVLGYGQLGVSMGEAGMIRFKQDKSDTTGMTWTMEFDKDKLEEKPGPTSNVVHLVSKSDPNKRLVVVLERKGGRPISVEQQELKDGVWTTQSKSSFSNGTSPYAFPGQRRDGSSDTPSSVAPEVPSAQETSSGNINVQV